MFPRVSLQVNMNDRKTEIGRPVAHIDIDAPRVLPYCPEVGAFVLTSITRGGGGGMLPLV